MITEEINKLSDDKVCDRKVIGLPPLVTVIVQSTLILNLIDHDHGQNGSDFDKIGLNKLDTLYIINRLISTCG